VIDRPEVAAEQFIQAEAAFQRRGACLFGHPITDWNKTSLMEELKVRGFELQTPSNGDIIVPNQLSLSFDEEERLIWVEIP
jgi:hypothetical protein